MKNWSPILVGVGVGTVLFVSTLMAGYTLYKQGKEAMHAELRGNLVRTAQAAAGLIDGDLHRTFVSEDQMSTPEYEQAVSPLKRFKRLNPDIACLYTMVLKDDELTFVLDPEEDGHEDRHTSEDGEVERHKIGEVYDVPREESWEMYSALVNQKATADEEIGAEDDCVYLAGYAPFYDSAGKFVGIVVVDLTTDDYNARVASFKKAGFLALTVSFLLSVLVGFLAALYQARSNRARKQSQEARGELELLAGSLDAANQNLQQASWRFEQLFNLLPVACFTFDADGVVYEWSKECEKQFGLEAYEAVQKSMFDTFVGDENRDRFKEIIETVMSGQEVIDFEWTDSDKYGRDFTTVLNVFPIKRHDKKVTGGIAACLDITERKLIQELFRQKVKEVQQAYSELDSARLSLEVSNTALTDANGKLEKMATIDSLTGLLNHGTVFSELNNAIAFAERHSRPLSIVMLDVDDFKRLNDTEGHLAGDAVLVSLAKTLQEGARKEDRVGRYGGEEFLVILPETAADEALEFAERLRTAVQVHTKPDGSVTASFGVATLDGASLTPVELIDQADQAMYKAKKGGKNRVVHARDRAAA